MRDVRWMGWALLALLALGCETDNPNRQADACVGAACGGDRGVDGATPDQALPDQALPDQALPDMAGPDRGAPDMTLDQALPDQGPPADMSPADQAVDQALPLDEGPAPDLAVEPDMAQPDMALPDMAQPDMALPDMAVGPCGPGREPAPEACNGVDDDCDNLIDEDVGLGDPCQAQGRCGVGFIECDGQGSVRCSTAPGGSVDQSQVERCNGRDDDCDGQVDEQPETLSAPCYDGPEGTEGVGACRAGVRACAEGRLQACADQVGPQPEACDGVDSDCDGVVDEGYVPQAVCGVGVCRATATPSACVGGAERACQPGPVQGDDANCDGLDDDCDGRTDEGYEPQVGCGVGRCGLQAVPSRCVAGVEQPCQPAPAAPIDQICDGVDDDCDGQTDEDYPPVAVCGQGVCRASSTPSSCVAGVETPCAPGAATGDDGDCDTLDQDCDGDVDEGYVPVRACGLGVCAQNVTPSRCVLGQVVACRPSAPQGDDRDCDGLDQDCDGRADEAYPEDFSCGVGVCAEDAVPSACVDGVESLCMPGAPLGELDALCDDVDDDCDGQTDEDVPQLVGDPVRITNHQGGAIEPRIVARQGGPGFAVAWSDNRAGAAGIYLQRLSEDGVARGAALRLANQAGVARQPDLTADGADTYAVVWASTATGSPQIYFARTGADGQIRQAALRLVQSAQDATEPVVVHNGQEYAVAWTDARDGNTEIYLRRLAADGQPIGEAQRITDVPGDAFGASLVHLGPGGGYMLAYNERVNGAVEAWVQRVNVNGRALGARLQISDNVGNSNGPRLARRAGEGFVVVWYDTRDNQTEIYSAELSALGVRQSDLLRVTQNNFQQTVPAITAADDGTFAVCWMDRRTGDDEIHVQRLDAGGVPRGPDVRVSNDPSTSFLPDVAFSGQTFGVVWYDGRHGEPEIYFHRGPLGCPL